jgi:ABC-type transport system involved in cytochrome c biogenesis permease subunit
MEIAQLTEIRYVVAPLYWLALVAYVVALRSSRGGLSRPATGIMIVAVAAHLAEYIGRGALYGAAGGAPFTGVSGFLSLAALLLGVGYLATESKLTTSALGAFAVPIVAALHTASVILFRLPVAVPEHLRGPHLVTHIALVTVACVGLAAALVSGVTYLALDAMLRWRRTGTLFRKLPNLDVLARVHRATLVVGASLLGLGALTGALWARSVWGFYFSWQQPKLVITLVAVLASVACALAWRFPSWRGRKAAWFAVSTVSITFAAMAFEGTFVNELHRFVQ